MNLTQATLGQLLYLSRHTEWRYEAIEELDRRIKNDELK